MSTQEQAIAATDRIREIAGLRLGAELPFVDPDIAEIRRLSGDIQSFFDALVREQSQPIAEERDALREALDGIMELAYSSRLDEALDEARAILAKYPKP